MKILYLDNRTSFVKASIPNFITKGYSDNHRLIINKTTPYQISNSSNLQIITIQYDQPLVAYITKNSDL